MKTFTLSTLKGRLAFWFTTICLVPLLLLSTAIYSQRVHLATALVMDKLSAVTALRQDQLNAMLDNLRTDVSTLSGAAPVRRAATSGDADAGAEFRAFLGGYQGGQQGAADVSIVAEDGTILFCTDPARGGSRIADPELCAAALRHGTPVFGEAYLFGNERGASMDLAAPVARKGGGMRRAVVVRYRLAPLLSGIAENRVGMGQSGEILLVNRNAMPLVELSGLPHAVLRTKVHGTAAATAAEGQSGIAHTADYRGIDVLAAYAHIPRTGWGMICKQDASEVYAPIRRVLYLTYGLTLLISALVCAFAFRLARGISTPLVDLSHAAAEIGAGDYAARIAPEGTEEQISLARTFNGMADTLQLKLAAQQGLLRLSERLVDEVSLEEFFRRILPVFCEVTGARMAAAFVREPEGDAFAPAHAIGADSARMRRYSRINLEGELGILLTARRITRYAPSPDGGALRFATSFGEIVPAEVVTIPIEVDGELHAFVSLAAEKPFPLWVHDTLEMGLMPLCSAYARVMAAEDVRRLASELAVKNAELTQQSEELVQQSTELAQQSDELARRNRVLDRQKQLLEEATRLKSEFLSNMSHELRTPLNSVLALSRVLAVQGAARLTEEERGYLAIIEKNGKHLLALINDILDLAKIESGRQDLLFETAVPERVAAEVVDGLSVLAREKEIALELRVPQPLPGMIVDVKKLRQMLQNLVGNAVKFTARGSVTLRLLPAEQALLFEVEDTGIGIAPQYLESIFQEFRQADGSTSRSYEGTGLGLAIVRKTARLLGGDVSVVSEPGKGSLFTLRLPLDCSTAAGSKEPVVVAPQAVQPVHEDSGRTVLVVDDDPEAVALIAGHLGTAGFETVAALSGAEAVQLARSRQPFAVTLDIMMPEMDGWEVMRELKEHPETADIPVVIVSLSEDRETGIALGAVGVISKPVGKEQLMETFARLTGAGCRLVLVVDDDEFDRFFIASLFKEKGLDVLLAADGPEALELAATDRPDLITLDLLMPGMDGAAVLDRLRSNECTADIPVVVITSKELSAAEMRRLASGVSAVLSKNGMDRRMVLDELVNSLERLGWRLPERRETKGARILVVEDSEAATIQLRFALESAGFRVDAVSGGRHALTYLKTHVPDGIILDLMMPEVDGFQVLQAVRASRLTAGVPVLVMTAKTLSPGEYDRLHDLDVHQLVQKGDVELKELLRRVYEMLGAVDMFRDGAPQAPSRLPAPAAGRKDGPLLVVEDNPDNLTTLKAVLAGGYRILEAKDGAAAVDAAVSALPSLILLDLHLPVMDGFAVLRKLKDDPATASIPVVALTASAMTGDREKALAAGCAGYLSKPYQPEELQEMVERFLGPGASGTA